MKWKVEKEKAHLIPLRSVSMDGETMMYVGKLMSHRLSMLSGNISTFLKKAKVPLADL